MAYTKEEYLLLKEMEFDATRIIKLVEETEDLRVMGNLYRDMGDLMDSYAEKIEDLER